MCLTCAVYLQVPGMCGWLNLVSLRHPVCWMSCLHGAARGTCDSTSVCSTLAIRTAVCVLDLVQACSTLCTNMRLKPFQLLHTTLIRAACPPCFNVRSLTTPPPPPPPPPTALHMLSHTTGVVDSLVSDEHESLVVRCVTDNAYNVWSTHNIYRQACKTVNTG